jgi:hypothetical protein
MIDFSKQVNADFLQKEKEKEKKIYIWVFFVLPFSEKEIKGHDKNDDFY